MTVIETGRRRHSSRTIILWPARSAGRARAGQDDPAAHRFRRGSDPGGLQRTRCSRLDRAAVPASGPELVLRPGKGVQGTGLTATCNAQACKLDGATKADCPRRRGEGWGRFPGAMWHPGQHAVSGLGRVIVSRSVSRLPASVTRMTRLWCPSMPTVAYDREAMSQLARPRQGPQKSAVLTGSRGSRRQYVNELHRSAK